jgi:pantoate--beta-alanine ligase
MGYLHAGHLRLAAEARAGNDLVIMSLYVNPAQFGPAEDLDRYPRDIDRDRSLAAEAGVDILFAPDGRAMYPRGTAGQGVWVDPGPLAEHLEGASRPGHFRGVATVVAKLLHMCEPDRAYFGQKDAQQATVARRMVEDVAFPVTICVIPTVREADGLALSSRNVYLSPQARAQAASLFRALMLARSLVESGERSPRRIEDAMCGLIREAAPLARLDYVRVADVETMRPLDEAIERDVVVALAAWFGTTRLIDNLMVRFVDGAPQFS